MKVILFAFDGNPDNPYLSENININSVCYTGTHDNETVRGYLSRLSVNERAKIRKSLRKSLDYLNIKQDLNSIRKMTEAFIKIALASESYLAVIPAQDYFYLNNNYRVNTPSTAGNWVVRLSENMFGESAAERIKQLLHKYYR